MPESAIAVTSYRTDDAFLRWQATATDGHNIRKVVGVFRRTAEWGAARRVRAADRVGTKRRERVVGGGGDV